MLTNYSIVMLKKDKYLPKHVTPADLTPRLLIIRVFQTSAQYVVRYPNGTTDRVNEDWLRSNGVYDPTHPSYATIAERMPAVEQEFLRNEPFRNFLLSIHPKLHTIIEQRIEASNQAKQERQIAHSLPFTLQIPEEIKQLIPEITSPENPTMQDKILNTLTSIDSSLKTLIQLWGGK